MTIKEICAKAKENASYVGLLTEDKMNDILETIASSLVQNSEKIIEKNKIDLDNCTRGEQFKDRLMLNNKRIEDIAEGLRQLKSIKTPVGEIIDSWTTETGLNISKKRVSLGVVAIIYEARPNVTVDAIGLCIKSGNAVVLRGSKDAIESNKRIVEVVKSALKENGYNSEFIQLIEDTTREGATELMTQVGLIDVLIPRGGAGLIKNVVENSKVPVIETGTGNCHIFVDEYADIDTAIKIILNAKTQRTSVCNALESLLVHRNIAKKFLPKLYKELKKANVEVVGCEKTAEIIDCEKASEEDFYTEFLSLKLSIKVICCLECAIDWINERSTHHSESIISKNAENIEKFLNEVDSACVYSNASTRFTDGFQFGFGAEMGISTQKMHARGPMGLKELTSYKYVVKGNGQTRS